MMSMVLRRSVEIVRFWSTKNAKPHSAVTARPEFRRISFALADSSDTFLDDFRPSFLTFLAFAVHSLDVVFLFLFFCGPTYLKVRQR